MRVVPAPDPTLPLNEQDLRFYRDVLHELINMGMDLARSAHRDAADDGGPAPEQLAAFDRLARCVRRSVLLARKLQEAPRRPTPEPRRDLLREINRRAASSDDPQAEALRANLTDRLDALDLDAALRRHSIPEIVDQICHDLGLPAAGWPHPRQPPGPAPAATRPAHPDRLWKPRLE